MANKHAGNLADVFKHLALGEFLAPAGPGGVGEYWESHAGAASYNEIAAIPPARRHGIHYFYRAARTHELLRTSAYGRLLFRGAPPLGEIPPLATIPGSPLLAHHLLVEHARRLLLCDTDADSLQSVARLAGTNPKVECVQDDGVLVLRGASLLLPQPWAATTLAFLDPYDLDAVTDAGISALDLWCEIAGRGIMAVLWYGFASDAHRADRHRLIQQKLDKARLAGRGGQRFEGALRHPASGPEPPATQWGFGLLTIHLPKPALDRADRCLQALQSLYEQAPLPTAPDHPPAPPGSGAWRYTRSSV
jgi:23S rRNA A2030 N6-methylase RlmJ